MKKAIQIVLENDFDMADLYLSEGEWHDANRI